jgi:hypothetical protein
VDYQNFNDFFVTVKNSTIFDAFFPFPTIGNGKNAFSRSVCCYDNYMRTVYFCIFILQHVSHATFPFPSIGNKKMHFIATIHFPPKYERAKYSGRKTFKIIVGELE